MTNVLVTPKLKSEKFQKFANFCPPDRITAQNIPEMQDLWSLGIFICSLLNWENKFIWSLECASRFDSNNYSFNDNIDFEFSDDTSSEIIDLILILLDLHSEKRYKSINDLKRHSFFYDTPK